MSAKYSNQLEIHKPASIPHFDTVDGEGFGVFVCFVLCFFREVFSFQFCQEVLGSWGFVVLGFLFVCYLNHL